MENLKHNNSDIPEMLDSKYRAKLGKSPAVANVSKSPQELQKEMEKAKKELDKLKNFILKKYPFVESVSIIPQIAVPKFIEEEEVPAETKEHHHLYVIIPESKLKEIPKIQQEIIREITNSKQKVWLQVKTPIDVWEICHDSKFELFSAIAMSYPLHDKGLLGTLRLAEIHKSLVLHKFDKYVVSYVFGGSFITEQKTKRSDVDIFVIINDTDVKRMPRLELKERLMSVIYQFIPEAMGLAGVKTRLHPQVFLLTEFWEAVKDAHPVMFTFIRDGVPIHDRGTFMPWKALLKMGRLRPSPEAIDMFLSIGDRTLSSARRGLLDIFIREVFHSVLTPSQGILMLYGLAPPTPRETIKELKEVFVQKEKLLERKHLDILENIFRVYKEIDHEKKKEITGQELDKFLKDSEEYIKKLKEVREKIEKKKIQEEVEIFYNDIIEQLKSIIGNKSQEKLVQDFEKEYVKKGKFSQQSLRALKEVIEAKKEIKKARIEKNKIDSARKNVRLLMNSLSEYSQRTDLAMLERGKMMLRIKDKNGKGQVAELINAGGNTFLIFGQNVKKISGKLEDSTLDKVTESIEKQKENKNIQVNPRVFETIKKEFGDYEIII